MDINAAEHQAREFLYQWLAKRGKTSWSPQSAYTFYFSDFDFFRKVSKLFEIPDYDDNQLIKVLSEKYDSDAEKLQIHVSPGVAWLAQAILYGGIDRGLVEFILILFVKISGKGFQMP